MARPSRRGRLGGSRRGPAEETKHREVMKVLTGLLLALFVAMLSGTIVGNALPVIIADLGGSQLQYTWIVTAALLASTASTPIFGKLADLFDKKKLLLMAIGLFSVGSLLAGMAQDPNMLIAFRVVQGVGMGAQMALVQVTIASIISPRERGRYNGYMGAVMAVATVSGPLIGGVIVDTPWLGWRWTYWSAIPFSLIAIWVLHRRLVVPPSTRRKPKVDYAGSALIVLSVTLLLLWLSFAGTYFEWVSWTSAAMIGGAVLGTVVFVLVERRAAEPVVPMWILTERTTALSIVASFSVGVIMFAAPVFLGQYFQIGRGYGPAAAGLLMVPMMLGVFLSSTIAGRLVSRRGTWKRYVIAGLSVQALGVGLMATVGASTPLWLVGAYLALMGIGQGASMQNLVLAVQNTVPLKDMGAASSAVAFFRSLGGAIGVQVLGAILTAHIGSLLVSRLTAAGYESGAASGTGDLDIGALPAPLQEIVRSGYGDGMGLIFLIMAVCSVVALVAAGLMRGSTLRDTVDLEVKRAVESASIPAGPATVNVADEAVTPVGPAVDEPNDDAAVQERGESGAGAGPRATDAPRDDSRAHVRPRVTDRGICRPVRQTAPSVGAGCEARETEEPRTGTSR
ncbi:MFS transporter [Georgenia wutianyii]|uniref:MFS transporter n=1 Tax=Georgenia wutianyii TaxID=2585135 RepID=A0ABX5VNF1_9MICO|nr:MDR family MFS transporter [Georgenia wutianyii]QDB78070.1 MFS transporter [Georgenia wutianyii]